MSTLRKNQMSEYIKEITRNQSEICPHCNTYVSLSFLHQESHTHRNKDIEYIVLFRCPKCTLISQKTLFFKWILLEGKEQYDPMGWLNKETTSEKETTTSIPKKALPDLEEGMECHSNSCYRGALLLFQRALCLSIAGKDEKAKDLILQSKFLTKEMQEWAERLNYLEPSEGEGNKERSEEAQRFLKIFFEYLDLHKKSFRDKNG